MSRYINHLRYDVEQNCHKFIQLMAAEGYDVLIAETTRTDATQYQYYLQGYAKVTTPSFHAEYAGLAFDVCKNVKGHEYDDMAFFEAAGRIGKMLGFTWGGDWTSFVDKPHFQWDNHGEYTGDMIRAKHFPPPMPVYKTSVEIVAERYGFKAPDYWQKTTTGEKVPTPENMQSLFNRIAGR